MITTLMRNPRAWLVVAAALLPACGGEARSFGPGGGTTTGATSSSSGSSGTGGATSTSSSSGSSSGTPVCVLGEGVLGNCVLGP